MTGTAVDDNDNVWTKNDVDELCRSIFGEDVEIIWTDPPYNRGKMLHIRGPAKGEFQITMTGSRPDPYSDISLQLTRVYSRLCLRVELMRRAYKAEAKKEHADNGVQES